MSERERFEAAMRLFYRACGAWSDVRFDHRHARAGEIDLDKVNLAGLAEAAARTAIIELFNERARSGQAASGSSQGARSDDQTAKRIFPPEPDPMPSICAGMTPEQVWEYGHLCGWRAGQPEAPTAAPLDPAALVAECAPYLKEGETPLQRIQRDSKDMEALLTLLSREKLRSMDLAEKLAARSGAGSDDRKDESWK